MTTSRALGKAVLAEIDDAYAREHLQLQVADPGWFHERLRNDGSAADLPAARRGRERGRIARASATISNADHMRGEAASADARLELDRRPRAPGG